VGLLDPSTLILTTLLAGSGASLAPGPEDPASASDPAADGPPVVVLMLPSLDDDRDERAEATIRAHLQELELEIVVERYAGEGPDLRQLFTRSETILERNEGRGIIWVDLGGAGQSVTLHVLERGGAQIYGRRIETADIGEAVAIESLANVSAMAAAALAEGRAIRLEPEPEQEPPESEQEQEQEQEREQEPAPPIEVEGQVIPQPWPRARLRIGYRGQSLAAELPWLSAAELAFGWRPEAAAHLELGYEAAPPVHVDNPALGVRLGLFRVPLFLAGGYRFDLRRGWGLELAARVGVESMRRQTEAYGDALLPADASWRVSLTGGADLRASVELREDIRLWFGLGLVGVFIRSDYVIEGTDTVLLAPSPLRASASAGFDFDLLHR
jgi:hypothetical protein